jgi:hypothetical protein
MNQRGAVYLRQASQGDTFSIYHIEASIAATRCLAAEASTTDWPRILHLYDQAFALSVTAMSRAVAVARVHGPKRGCPPNLTSSVVESKSAGKRWNEFLIIVAWLDQSQARWRGPISLLEKRCAAFWSRAPLPMNRNCECTLLAKCPLLLPPVLIRWEQLG